MINDNNSFDLLSRMIPTGYGYNSAFQAVKEGFMRIEASGSQFEKYDRPTLVSKSRELYRNSSIYAGVINKVVQYVVDRGLTLQALTNIDFFNKILENKWYKYFQHPEITNTYNGTSLTQAILREYLLTGEAFLLLLDKSNGYKVQLIEAEQITSSDNRVGITVDENGKAISYFVTPYDTTGNLDFTKTKEYAAESIVHLRKLDRPSSLRGMPLLQSAFSIITKIESVCKNEIAAMEVQSCFSMAVTRDKANSPILPGANRTATDEMTRVTQINQATIVHCNPGESVTPINRNIPSVNFREAINVFMNHLATPLGLCSEIVSNDWTSSNFSQSKVAINSSYNSFRIIQDVIVSFALDILYEYVVTMWIKDGEITLPDYIDQATVFNHQFLGPMYPSIDQLKDTQAQTQQIEMGLTTYGDSLNQNSKDYEDTIAKRKREITNAIAISKQIETDTKVYVPYQVFCGLPIPTDSKSLEEVDDELDDSEDDNANNNLSLAA